MCIYSDKDVEYLKNQNIKLTENQLEGIVQFCDNFYQVNSTKNLTTIPRNEFFVKHFIDSILIQKWIPEKSKVLDIGCGPGFPAWPLAYVRSDIHVTGLDSSQKMLGFLETQKLDNLTTYLGRAEEYGKGTRGKGRGAFDVVTGRAVAPFKIQAEISAPFLKKGGLWIPLRTIHEKEAIEQIDFGFLGLELRNVEQVKLPFDEIIRLFPVYEKVSKTPGIYPRSWSSIKKDSV